MIRRSVLVRCLIFVVVAALGTGYLLVKYVDVGAQLLGRQYTVYLDLPDSGGIFPTAGVSYRGVEIGRVGPITLRPGGIRVALQLASADRIPGDVHAIVTDGSPIGEQYVDLLPQSDNTSSNVLHQGSVIQGGRSSLPVSSEQVLVSLDRLLRSVPRRQLSDLVAQLGTAFADTGPSLGRLLDATQQLTTTATQQLPRTVGLLNSGGRVLDTQNALSADITGFARHLASFTDELKAHNGDLSKLIANTPPAAEEATNLVNSVDATLPVLLGNLVSVGKVSEVRVPALRQILIIYPYVIATSYGLFPDNGSTRFGVPLPPSTESQPCTTGYVPAGKRRLPTQLKYPKLRWNDYCKSPLNSGVDPRGSREAPEPDGKRLGSEPSYKNNTGLPGGGRRHSTQGSIVLGSTGGQARLLGDRSWESLVFGPLQ